MNVIVCDTYNELSLKAARLVAEEINKKKDLVLGLNAGSTPLGLYQKLTKMHELGEVDFKDVTTFNLNEYFPISPDNEQSFRYFMNKNFFEKINIDIKNTHILNGMANNPDAECELYEKTIEAVGGIDLQVLGVGQNGHIALNEPTSELNTHTHLTSLSPNTIEVNSKFFEDVSDVPTHALTVGIGTILKAKKIILLANGKSKRKVVKQLLNDTISTNNPSSLLKLHPDVTLICDKNAFSNQKIGVDIGGTKIKFGVLDDSNELIYKDIIPTITESKEKLIESIVEKCKEITSKYSIVGIGVGVPGLIQNGKVSAVNLPFDNTDIVAELKKYFNLPIQLSNDANCAALAEATCGEGAKYSNVVMISLGTGIGGGIIINNKIYEGIGSAGEIGHIIIEQNGRKCPCGQSGCFERYASAKALMDDAKAAALKNKDSILYKIYSENENDLSGHTFFEAYDSDCPVAKKVMDDYLLYLASGILSIYRALNPDLIVLAGGITNRGDAILEPLKSHLNGLDINIKISSLKSEAGTIGAALLIQ